MIKLFSCLVCVLRTALETESAAPSPLPAAYVTPIKDDHKYAGKLFKIVKTFGDQITAVYEAGEEKIEAVFSHAEVKNAKLPEAEVPARPAQPPAPSAATPPPLRPLAEGGGIVVQSTPLNAS